MKNKSLITKILIFGIITIIVIVLIVNILSKIISELKKDKLDSNLPEIDEYIENTTGKIQKSTDGNSLYQVQSCIQKYYINYSAMFGENTITQVATEEYNKEDYKKSTYNMLAPKYIEKNGITLENIDKSNEVNLLEPEIEIYKLYVLTKYNGIYAYFANGFVRDSITYDAKEFNIIVVLDENNRTFDIYPDSDFSNINVGETVDFELPDSIENRKDNVYGYVTAKYEDIAEDKFNNIRRLLLNSPEKAYELLTEEMKSSRFNTYQKFTEFINNNRKTIFLLTYSNYYLNNNDGSITFKTYNKDDKICINIYFDKFSSFTFDIEGL